MQGGGWCGFRARDIRDVDVASRARAPAGLSATSAPHMLSGGMGGGLVVVHPPRRVRTCLRQSELRRARSPSSVVSKGEVHQSGRQHHTHEVRRLVARPLSAAPSSFRAARPASRRTSTAAPYAPTSTNSGSSSPGRANETCAHGVHQPQLARDHFAYLIRLPGSSRRSSRRWPRPSQPSSRERLAPDPAPIRCRNEPDRAGSSPW